MVVIALLKSYYGDASNALRLLAQGSGSPSCCAAGLAFSQEFRAEGSGRRLQEICAAGYPGECQRADQTIVIQSAEPDAHGVGFRPHRQPGEPGTHTQLALRLVW
jgi:hypothetical protein